MESFPAYLLTLDEELSALPEDSDAMLLADLDGFVAGILVCPETIPDEEWISFALGEKDPPSLTPGQRETLTRLILRHRDTVAAGIRVGDHPFAPIFGIDEQGEPTIWRMWAMGFGRAVARRPDSWSVVEQADEFTAFAMTSLLTYVAITLGKADLPDGDIEDLEDQAFDLIGESIDVLYALKIGEPWRYRPREPYRAPPKVGRNEPCPCGSGKKYKKCCGANLN